MDQQQYAAASASGVGAAAGGGGRSRSYSFRAEGEIITEEIIRAKPVSHLVSMLFQGYTDASIELIAKHYADLLKLQQHREKGELFLCQLVQYLVHVSNSKEIGEDPICVMLLNHSVTNRHFGLKFYWQVNCTEAGLPVELREDSHERQRCDRIRELIVDYSTFGTNPSESLGWTIPLTTLQSISAKYLEIPRHYHVSTTEAFLKILKELNPNNIEFLISYYKQHNSFLKNITLIHILCKFSQYYRTIELPKRLPALREQMRHMNSLIDEDTVIPLFPMNRLLQFCVNECSLVSTSKRVLTHIFVEIAEPPSAETTYSSIRNQQMTSDFITDADLWLRASCINTINTSKSSAATDTRLQQAERVEPLASFGMEAAMRGGNVVVGVDNDPTEAVVVMEEEEEEEEENGFVVVEGSIFGFDELYTDKAKRIKDNSPYKNLPTWNLKSFFAKDFDDLRHDQLAMQIIHICKSICLEREIDLKLQTYEIIATSDKNGIIETVPSAIPIGELKNRVGTSLYEFFYKAFEKNKELAKQNFIHSMAGYSLICYILDIGDRHEANILLNSDGCVVHIDFGFILETQLTADTGGPFKLTREYVRVMAEGESIDPPEASKGFQEFKQLFIKGFNALREEREKINIILKALSKAGLQALNSNVIEKMNNKFFVDVPDEDLPKCLEGLFTQALGRMSIAKMNDDWKQTARNFATDPKTAAQQFATEVGVNVFNFGKKSVGYIYQMLPVYTSYLGTSTQQAPSSADTTQNDLEPPKEKWTKEN